MMPTAEIPQENSEILSNEPDMTQDNQQMKDDPEHLILKHTLSGSEHDLDIDTPFTPFDQEDFVKRWQKHVSEFEIKISGSNLMLL